METSPNAYLPGAIFLVRNLSSKIEIEKDLTNQNPAKRIHRSWTDNQQFASHFEPG